MGEKASKGVHSPKEKLGLIGPATLTKFERARIIGARALQISMGAPVLADVQGSHVDPLRIAEEELLVLPLTIRRRLPNGRFADIPLKQLLTGAPESSD